MRAFCARQHIFSRPSALLSTAAALLFPCVQSAGLQEQDQNLPSFDSCPRCRQSHHKGAHAAVVTRTSIHAEQYILLKHVNNAVLLCIRAHCRSKPNLLSFNSRVSFVGTGFIKLDRQLPYNVSTRWAPGLHIFDRKWLSTCSTPAAIVMPAAVITRSTCITLAQGSHLRLQPLSHLHMCLACAPAAVVTPAQTPHLYHTLQLHTCQHLLV